MKAEQKEPAAKLRTKIKLLKNSKKSYLTRVKSLDLNLWIILLIPKVMFNRKLMKKLINIIKNLKIIMKIMIPLWVLLKINFLTCNNSLYK